MTNYISVNALILLVSFPSYLCYYSWPPGSPSMIRTNQILRMQQWLRALQTAGLPSVWPWWRHICDRYSYIIRKISYIYLEILEFNTIKSYSEQSFRFLPVESCFLSCYIWSRLIAGVKIHEWSPFQTNHGNIRKKCCLSNTTLKSLKSFITRFKVLVLWGGYRLQVRSMPCQSTR